MNIQQKDLQYQRFIPHGIQTGFNSLRFPLDCIIITGNQFNFNVRTGKYCKIRYLVIIKFFTNIYSLNPFGSIGIRFRPCLTATKFFIFFKKILFEIQLFLAVQICIFSEYLI
jgi:hypothetical protein